MCGYNIYCVRLSLLVNFTVKNISKKSWWVFWKDKMAQSLLYVNEDKHY